MIRVVIRWLVERYPTSCPDDRHNSWVVNGRKFELGYAFNGSDFVVLVEMGSKVGSPSIYGQKLLNHVDIKFADPEMFDKIIEFCES